MSEKEIKKVEGIKRMMIIGMPSWVIEDFQVRNMPSVSENTSGILYRMNPEQEKMVRDFESEYNAVVYHIIHQVTHIGEMYSFLYISDSEEEWEFDTADIVENTLMVYVINTTYPDFSEFGRIGFKVKNGVVFREW